VSDRLSDPHGAMRAYYDRRAGEYDSWWLGTRLFNDRERPGWDDEREQLLAQLRALPPARTLDVACGSGFLTRALLGDVTGVDQSASMVEVARANGVHAVQGEGLPLAFEDGAFDRVFTSHFYGHLQPDERAAFVAEARRVGTELIICDSALRDGVSEEEWQERVLEDGSRTQVYKRYFSGASLAAELGGGEILLDGTWFAVVRAAS
jgi:demethylmenaquinone methyltransferase/2-methoxy-6-polyprenyl-1,4-benzoquinol methylase